MNPTSSQHPKLVFSNRRFAIFFTFVLSLFLFPFSAAGQTFVAVLSGNHSVPPALTTANGQITANLSGTTLTLSGSFSGLIGDFNTAIAGGSHLHNAFAGRTGPIEIALVPMLSSDLRSGSYSVAMNTFTLTAAQLEALTNRQLYVNIHTTAFPGGEIRGQLLPASDSYFATNLFGSNEVPSIMSDGRGALVMELSGSTLTVSGSYNNMAGNLNTAVAGGAHLHAGRAGQNGGIEISLNATPDASANSGLFLPDSNTFVLTPSQIMLLEDRMLYANVHSTVFGSGELRGQARPVSTAIFRTHLSGSNEAPPIVSGATGEMLFELNRDTLRVSGTFNGLESDLNTAIAGGAHLHLGIAGLNGPVSIPLSPTVNPNQRGGAFDPALNVFVLDSVQKAALLSRRMYVNIHSINRPAGELRGQILPEANYYLNAHLTGTQEAPPVLSEGNGALKAEVLGTRLVVSGSFGNLGSDFNTAVAGGAHLHLAMAGSTGGIEFPLSPVLNPDNRGGVFPAAANTFSLSTGQRDTLRARWFYANIHSQNIVPGELRGQLLHEATAYFLAPLSGSSQPTAVQSEGRGTMILEWTANRAFVSGSFRNLESDFNPAVLGGSHIHAGFPGRNGGIEFNLTPTLGASNRDGRYEVGNNIFTLSPGQVDTLRQRMWYVNIHTVATPSGEIRGNFLHQAMAYFTASAAGMNEVQPVMSNGNGGLKLELTGDRLTVTGGFSNLDGDFNAAIGGGSHLHSGGPGTTGGVAIGLVASVDPGMKSGVYKPVDNSFVLADSIKDMLLAGGLYFNLHSTTVVPGEIRGQVLPETNFFPNADAAITAPADGATLNISGPDNTPFVPQWDAGTDPDGNSTASIWQLSLADDFTSLILNINLDTAAQFVTDFGTVDSILAANGVNIGDTATLYHRTLTTDGSLRQPGDFATVILVRGTVTGILQTVLPDFGIKVFPSPASFSATVRIESETGGEGSLAIMDLAGRTLGIFPVRLSQGATELQLDLNSWAPGIYLVRLQLDGRLAAIGKFEKY